MKDPNTIHSTTQQFLDIYDITNDILILKDGSASLILQVNAVNFGLLAEAEQDAIIYAYAGLLNSLNFAVQIVIHSETKDVSHYLQSLQEQEEATTSDTRQQQIRKYRTFVSDLIRERNVLDKKFYFVIPASALELGLVSAQSVVPGVKKQTAVELDRSLILDRALTNLYPKRDHLIGQFARIGLYARQLTTQEIIHLFYNLYNPEAAEGQTISNTQNYTTAVVEAMQGDTMLDTSNQTPITPISAPSAASAVPGTQASTPVPPSAPMAPITPITSPAAPSATPSATPPSALPPLPNMPTPPNPVAPVVPETPTTPVMPVNPQGNSSIPQPTPSAMSTPPAQPTPSAQPAPVPTMTPAQPPATKPPMTAPQAAPVASSAPTPAVESDQDAQSLINNTLQQIDPGALAGGASSDQTKTE